MPSPWLAAPRRLRLLRSGFNSSGSYTSPFTPCQIHNNVLQGILHNFLITSLFPSLNLQIVCCLAMRLSVSFLAHLLYLTFHHKSSPLASFLPCYLIRYRLVCTHSVPQCCCRQRCTYLAQEEAVPCRGRERKVVQC